MRRSFLLLRFSAGFEVLGGIFAFVMPVRFCTLLFGHSIDNELVGIARLFALAIIALGFACWEASSHAPMPNSRKSLCGYNIAVGILLMSIGVSQDVIGVLLWPGVFIHLAIGFLLLPGLRKQ
ncbi:MULTISPECIES: hypothetical protein [unclassified Prochlorococcus]|uniref:hypothetical protein n=1 Tax=unclassified Prochlorococcus TaxID=2627481 RepID=UPI0005338A90|nr:MULTISPECIES: hypothetical protein [unclassified Prochlorococcus]KGG26549.1 hypothetical protein EV12_1638 [Prochlorococcus sp. MIT 0701]KGG30104.1 hypothetical protein EV13_0435 [Prochlorococcus sp. MIT 0702]KGG33239.1 hypothetical protein EV14_1710 [Prochlorococcus sp. MIT 0703]